MVDSAPDLTCFQVPGRSIFGRLGELFWDLGLAWNTWKPVLEQISGTWAPGAADLDILTP